MKKIFFFMLAILLAILCFIAYECSKTDIGNLSFVIRDNNITKANEQKKDIKPFFEAQIIPEPSSLLFSHSASLVKLGDGDLLAVWFAGSDEGVPDVKIWESRYHNGLWSMAVPILSDKEISLVTKHYVRKVGNPVIYRAQDGKIYLFVVTAIGGWAASSLVEAISPDNGVSWGHIKRIILSPFFDLSTLCRTNGVSLSGGYFYLPVYQESITDYPELLLFDNNGNYIKTIRVSSLDGLLQPTLVPITDKSAYIYFRNNGDGSRPIYRKTTIDSGFTWSELEKTNFTNPNSSLVVVKLSNGQFLMVRNPENRGKLVLSVSDDGLVWKDIYTLEDDMANSYCYPAVVEDGDIIDILYSWKKERIKHVRFNLSWLESLEH